MKMSLKAIAAVSQRPAVSHPGWNRGASAGSLGKGVMPKKKKKKRGY